MNTYIDTEFNMYSDTPAGKDPDSRSPTLRRYHRALWSKPLPNGQMFNLSTSHPGSYLFHESDLGVFHLSSDSLAHTYRDWKSMAPIISEIAPDETMRFYEAASTIGSYIIFPARTVNGKQNINMARGTNAKIKDRFDLTLECIRRHYLGVASPLSEVLERYSEFFGLFGSFEDYVEFFLLQDLLNDSNSSIRYFLPFKSFDHPAVPQNISQYREYRDNVMKFIAARNRRINLVRA